MKPPNSVADTMSTDPRWLNEQYHASARVPDMAGLVGGWISDSQASRKRLECVLDIAYGRGERETLDVFPAAPPESPVIVFIHGGYWRSTDKSMYSFIAEEFVKRGITVVLPTYPLCPEVSIEKIALCMSSAMAWIWGNIGRWGGDRNRLTIIGHSAGAHLAAMMATCQWGQMDAGLPRQLFKNILTISGVFDLSPFLHATFIKDDLRLTPESARRLSPSGFPPPKNLHMTVSWGALETSEFPRQSLLLQRRWGKSVIQKHLSVPGSEHFGVLRDLADPKGLLHKHALKLVENSALQTG